MTERKKIVLFDSKDKCCACGACMNVCPKQAISMEEDEFGFLFPCIDYDKCIGCGSCERVCSYQNTSESNTPITAYAVVNNNYEQKILSASGGLFAAFATSVIQEGGTVFGCALDVDDSIAVPHHIAVNNMEELIRLQGSKYVQSSTEYTYSNVLELLKDGEKVLYSGTPCQIAGLKGFLKKDHDNLILVDLICHGVPNARFFNDYLAAEKRRRKWKAITGYSFRDKKKGWGMNCRIDAIDKKGKQTAFYTPARLASYNTLFLDGLTYRENCYKCKYACKNRPGDISIGDYWGIEKEHPELLSEKGFEQKDGISCVIVNTPKGEAFFEGLGTKVISKESRYEKVANRNKQLNNPSAHSSKREIVMEKYKNDGYDGVEDWYFNSYRMKRMMHFIYNKIPYNIRKRINKFK